MSDTEMTEKRSSDEFESQESSKQAKYEEPSTEELEEAMYQTKKCAAAGRAHMEAKCKEFFKTRNGFEPTSAEMENCFNTLRDSMMDSEAAQSSSSDEEEEDSEEFAKMQNDISSAFENVRDCGKEAGKKMQDFMKKLWCKENNGGEPSQEEMDAVVYNLKHMCRGMVACEDESDTDGEDYEPSELEKEKAEEESAESAEKEECSFDFPSQCTVSEEQFEAACAKFCEEKGRSPTAEEADSIIESFKQKWSEASYGSDSDSDYEQGEEEESEDESCAEDNSLETAEEMEVEEEESEECDYTAENKSDAFNYMEELEEPSSGEEEEEEEEKPEEAAEEQAEAEAESSKQQQAQEMSTVHQVCA